MIIWKEPVAVNCLVLKENIAEGQRIKNIDIILSIHGIELKKLNVTTVGHKRIISFPTEKVTEISVVVNAAKAKPMLSSVEAYHIAENLIEK